MTVAKKLRIVVLAVVAGLLGADAGERLSILDKRSFVSTAEARVGRPLTPVSVAGATRRTVRRCAAGVYNC
jgi:hypothetical protein